MTMTQQSVGELLREWRERRRLSQLDLASESDISSRHLSFLETGRSQPSREMVLKLSERLEIPLRERNVLLVAAGYAPIFTERSLDDTALQAAREAIDLVLTGHEPYPALAIDHHWTLLAANKTIFPLLGGVAPALLEPPINVLRMSLHLEGLAPRIANYDEWRSHLLTRLRRQIDLSADKVLVELMSELRSYPYPARADSSRHESRRSEMNVVVPLELKTDAGVLSFISTTTVFGTPLDITLSEIALESFFPANPKTAEVLRQLATTVSRQATRYIVE
jgi:transcriptional regulator with XRE-family HTH domain